MNEAVATMPADFDGPPMFGSRMIRSYQVRCIRWRCGGEVRTFSFVHLLASPEELWNCILARLSGLQSGIRRQPRNYTITCEPRTNGWCKHMRGPTAPSCRLRLRSDPAEGHSPESTGAEPRHRADGFASSYRPLARFRST